MKKLRIPDAVRPFRLIRQDVRNLRLRYWSDWTTFNQLVFASAVYVFFTNLLPGITFASDLYQLTGKSWGTIEVVFSTGLCSTIFSMYVLSLLDFWNCKELVACDIRFAESWQGRETGLYHICDAFETFAALIRS